MGNYFNNLSDLASFMMGVIAAGYFLGRLFYEALDGFLDFIVGIFRCLVKFFKKRCGFPRRPERKC